MHRHRILIVEDDLSTRSSLGTIFSRMGWLVRLAATASEGMEWINSGQTPCCLLIDLNLPDGRGEWVMQLARERGVHAFFAVCTGVCDEQRLTALKALEPDVIWAKPITAVDLGTVVCPLIDLQATTDDWPVMS